LAFWLLVILAFCAYVAADAAFDVSKKISAFVRLRAWPFIRRVWGAVVGVARKRAAPAAPDVSRKEVNNDANRDNVPLTGQQQPDQTPPNNPIRLPSIGSVLAWCWKWKAPLLVLAGFVIVVSLMRGCSIPGIGKSRDTLRAELENAEAEIETQENINARDAEIAEVARDVALMRQQLQNLSQRGRDEIAAATPSNEAPLDAELVGAWRRALDGLCVVRVDGTRADSCG
jgi:hypothetical protein